LPEIEFEGQKKLLQSHCLIVGAGGLGSPVAIYLAASGVGKITIVILTALTYQIFKGKSFMKKIQ